MLVIIVDYQNKLVTKNQSTPPRGGSGNLNNTYK